MVSERALGILRAPVPRMLTIHSEALSHVSGGVDWGSVHQAGASSASATNNWLSGQSSQSQMQSAGLAGAFAVPASYAWGAGKELWGQLSR